MVGVTDRGSPGTRRLEWLIWDDETYGDRLMYRNDMLGVGGSSTLPHQAQIGQEHSRWAIMAVSGFPGGFDGGVVAVKIPFNLTTRWE